MTAATGASQVQTDVEAGRLQASPSTVISAC